MDLDGIMLIKLCQTWKDNTVFYHLYVESKIKINNNYKKNRFMDIEYKVVVTSRERKVGSRRSN